METERKDKARFTLTTIDGKMHLQAVNPFKRYKINYDDSWENGEIDAYENSNDRHDRFKRNNPPILWIGPELPEGTVLKDEEVEIKEQFFHKHSNEWTDTHEMLYWKSNGNLTRQVATLKEPTKEEGT